MILYCVVRVGMDIGRIDVDTAMCIGTGMGVGCGQVEALVGAQVLPHRWQRHPQQHQSPRHNRVLNKQVTPILKT